MALTKPFAFQAPVAEEGGAIVTTNLQHWWTVLDTASYPGSGTTWTDLQGNTNLTLGSGVSYTTLGGYNTLYSTSSSKTVGYAQAGVYSGTIQAAYTVEAWVWVNTSQGTSNNFPPIFEYGGYDVGSTAGVFSNFRKDRNTLASYNFGSAGWVYDNIDTNDFTRNTWQHFVYAQSSTNMVHYVNGSQSYSASKSYSSTSASGKYRLWSDNDRYFQGGIAVVRVYNGHTLSATEVTNNYDVEKASFGL